MGLAPACQLDMTVSPQDVAAMVGLPAEKLDKPCEESSLPSLAKFVHPWRHVFSYLLDTVDLEDVESENNGRPEQMKRLDCLRKWKAKCGAQATYGAVVKSVLESGRVDNAEVICRHLLQVLEVEQEGGD